MEFQIAKQKAGSARALADLFGVSVQAVYRWARDGELPASRVYELRVKRPEWFEARDEVAA